METEAKLSTRLTKHLSETEIFELTERYDNGDKVKDLINEYDIDVRANELYSFLPDRTLNIQCPFCKAPMYIPRTARSSNFKLPTSCYTCSHKHYDENIRFDSCKGYVSECNCEKCVNNVSNANVKRAEDIYSTLKHRLYISMSNPINLSDIGLHDKIILLALIKHQISHDSNSYEHITPGGCDDYHMIKHLHNNNMIAVDPNSNVLMFSEYPPYSITYIDDYMRIKWIPTINVSGNGNADTRSLHDTLVRDLSSVFCTDALDDITAMIKLNNKAEFTYYLKTRIYDAAYARTCGNEANNLFRLIHTNKSLGEMLSHIDSSMNTALKYYETHTYRSPDPFKDKVLSGARKSSKTPIKKEAYIDKSSRPPRSALTSVVYDIVLDRHFDEYHDVVGYKQLENMLNSKIYKISIFYKSRIENILHRMYHLLKRVN